jgi:hypothetical protein
MLRDVLFLLTPGFMDGEKGPYYCPACATLEGLLAGYPELRERIDVRHVSFTRPRAPLVEMLGAANQGLPALIIHNAPRDGALAGLDLIEANGHRFLRGPIDIGRYLARTQGCPEPR